MPGRGHLAGSCFGPRGSVILLLMLLAAVSLSNAEPVILRGNALPGLVGKQVASLRMCTADGTPVPFQVDELTAEGEYVCDAGESPNSDSGNGVLDTSDEIVFMREDARICPDGDFERVSTAAIARGAAVLHPVITRLKDECRIVYITADTAVKKSNIRYIKYDHFAQMVSTPRYYAQFGKNRFHFVKAGIAGKDGKGWIHLTRRLRVEIFLSALWGLIPIHYTEDNLICYVKRYKVGPVRLIRRGDFHLRLGMGIQGSRASVNQYCYPRMVCVPVNVHVPVKFRRFFSEAWIEMMPVIDSAGLSFSFSVPECGINEPFKTNARNDTLMSCIPMNKLFTVQEGSNGYGWLLTTTIPDSSLSRSVFTVKRSLIQDGIAACGFRLQLRDLERGRYTILNRVLFSSGPAKNPGEGYEALRKPCTVSTNGGNFINRIND